MLALWLNRGASDLKNLAKTWARFLHTFIFENAKTRRQLLAWFLVDHQKTRLIFGALNIKHNKKEGLKNG